MHHGWFRGGPVEDGAVIGQFYLDVTDPDPVMDVEPEITGEVAFSEGSPATNGRGILSTLFEIRVFLENQVFGAHWERRFSSR